MGSPKGDTPVQESRASGRPVAIDSDTLVTTTFHTAADDVTASRSQRFCAAPSIVLRGPSLSLFRLRY